MKITLNNFGLVPSFSFLSFPFLLPSSERVARNEKLCWGPGPPPAFCEAFHFIHPCRSPLQTFFLKKDEPFLKKKESVRGWYM